jgi:hypothetical protein
MVVMARDLGSANVEYVAAYQFLSAAIPTATARD